MNRSAESPLRPVAAVLAATFLCYGGPAILGLGFHHDDWPILEHMIKLGGGFVRVALGQFEGTPHAFRPLSVLCWTIPYWLFGLKAGLWQCAAAGVTAAMVLTFYRLLRVLGAGPTPALLAALFMLAFPNKDTTLFWLCSAIPVSLSLTLFLGACLAHARYARDGRPASLAAAVGLLVLSLSAYEQGFFLLPLWMLSPGLFDDMGRWRRTFQAGVAALAVFLVVKMLILPLWFPYNKTPAFSSRHAAFVAYMALRALLDPRWLLYLARCFKQAWAWHPVLSAAGLLLPFAVASTLRTDENRDGAAARRLMLWGIGAWFLGYLPLCFSEYSPAAYDHMNRMNLFPAAGLCAVACGWATKAKSRERVLAAAAGLSIVLCVAFSGIWREAYRRELDLRAKVLAILPEWPKDKVLLVVLPDLFVARKAPVFLGGYDTGAAIRIWTGEPERLAAAYGEWVRPGPDAIDLYGGITPYSKVLVLDAVTGRTSPLDAVSARALPPVVQPWEKPLVFWPEDRP